MRTLVLAAVLVTISATNAEASRVCRVVGLGVRTVYSEGDAPCKGEELVQAAYQCDLVSGLPHCDPPARYAHPNSPATMQGALFAGEVIDRGMAMWQWKDPSTGLLAFTSTRFWMP